MMFKSTALRYVPFALTLIGLVPSTAVAGTLTTYPFNATYDVVVTAKEITPDIEQTFISGTSTDAAYGLTKVNGLAYSQTNFTSGIFSSNTDPNTFGLQGYPLGYIAFSGNGNDSLSGNQITSGLIDFSTLKVTSSGTVTLSGGSGQFGNATGILTFSQVQPLSLQPGVVLKGEAKVNGSLQVVSVPEPKTDAIPLVIGMIAAIMKTSFTSKRNN
ncbi:MAG: hypothetical protein HWQ37_21735 [Nostoc sp. NMS4]|nr:hypothetical protein [Nostoc sp. NMS4]